MPIPIHPFLSTHGTTMDIMIQEWIPNICWHNVQEERETGSEKEEEEEAGSEEEERVCQENVASPRHEDYLKISKCCVTQSIPISMI